jgi:hypothetical protein
MTLSEFEAMKARNPALAAVNPDNRSEPPPAREVNRTTRLERQHQSVFANHCLSKGYAYTWHRTDKPSTASPGTPDFIVGANERTYWIEFKLPGQKLSPDQEDFEKALTAQGLILYVVYSDAEAIQIIEDDKGDGMFPSMDQQPCPSGPMPQDDIEPMAPTNNPPSGGPFSKQRQSAQDNRRRITNAKAKPQLRDGPPAGKAGTDKP